MRHYRFACALLLLVASSVSGDNPPPSTISLHQSASASGETFTPLAGYDDGGGDDGGGGGGSGSLFAADAPAVEPVFAPTLPIPEKQVLELAGVATSASGRGSSRPAAPADDEHRPAAQKIYPTFFRNIPPLGHSRPYYQSTEAAIEQRFNKLRAAALPEVSSPLLGSGDFGVIKGGTFYYDTDAPGKGFADEFYGLGYSGNNGHGRPQLAYLVQKPHQKEEQFSNFRDFADINISNDPAYSHHAPLYAAPDPGSLRHEPDNILDELRSLDLEPTVAPTPTPPPTTTARSGPGKGRGKAKKSTRVERKKRPKSATDAADDYMLAAS